MKNIVFAVSILFTAIVCTPTYAEIIGNTDKEVRTIAAPILDNIIEGIKTGDYAKYVEHFDKTMKEAVPKANFFVSNMQIQNLFGQYLYRHYLGFLKKGDMTLVLWKARYNKTEDDVLVKMILSKRERKYFVTGLFFQ
jgi:hypothetical protein